MSQSSKTLSSYYPTIGGIYTVCIKKIRNGKITNFCYQNASALFSALIDSPFGELTIVIRTKNITITVVPWSVVVLERVTILFLFLLKRHNKSKGFFSKLTWWLQNLQDQCFTKFSHAIISSVPLLPLSISISSSIWGRLDFLQRIWYDFLIYGRFPLRAIMDALIHGISLFLYQWTEAKHKKISAHLMFVVFDSNTYSISRKDNYQISECDKRYPSFRLLIVRWCCTAKVM